MKLRQNSPRQNSPRQNSPRSKCFVVLVACVVLVLIHSQLRVPEDFVFFATTENDKNNAETGTTNNDCNKHAVVDDHRLCYENPYSPSLSLPLKEYGDLMDDWIKHKTEKERKLTTVMRGLPRDHTHTRFNAFEVMGSCNQTCIGGACKSDLSKIVCLGGVGGSGGGTIVASDQQQQQQQQEGGSSRKPPACVVYSIGGNNQWDFELDVLAKTPCDVHTFDCTGPIGRFHKPDSDRSFFHHVCLGTENKPAPAPDEIGGGHQSVHGEFWTLEKIQRTLGHTRIDLFKVDIEGYEWPMFESWPLLSEKKSPDTVLPMQVLVEVHYQTQMPELSDKNRAEFKWSNDMIRMQERFLRMGYAVVVRDDNKHCPHCTELTLVRIRCPPPPPASVER